MKNCPCCETALEEITLGDVAVDGCHRCGGVWFDHDELGVLANRQAAHLSELDSHFQPEAGPRNAPTQRLCPTCRVALFEFEYQHSPGIKVDGCPQCKGVWLDEGEMQAFYQRLTGAQQAAQAAMKARARQASGLLTTTLCPGCSQPNPAASLDCLACGASLRERKGRLCPYCDLPLAGKTYLGKQVDICPTCCGVWLDTGELAALVRLSEESLLPMMRELDKPAVTVTGMIHPGDVFLCPQCYTPLQEQQYSYNSGIRIDSCDRCSGVWLGPGEFAGIVRYYRASLR